MQTYSYIIIFGAAVKVNGEPSGAMKRRVGSAIHNTKKIADVMFIVTGGVGKDKSISEAEVMKKLLLNAGISETNIIIENKANDTLSSVVYCNAILNTRNDIQNIYVCSDTYHIPRCRWLFFLFGIKTNSLKVRSGLQVNGLSKWVFYYIREVVALPYDSFLVLLHKFRIKTIR